MCLIGFELCIVVYWRKIFHVGNYGPIWVRNGLEKQKYARDWKDPLRAKIESITSSGNTSQKVELKHDKDGFWK